MMESYYDSPLSKNCDSVMNKLRNQFENKHTLLLGLLTFFVAAYDTS